MKIDKIILSALIFLLFGFAACTQNQKATSNSIEIEHKLKKINANQINDFIIDTGRVGIISDNDSKEKIIQKFGKEYTSLDSFYLEGMFQEIVLEINKDQKDELEIHFDSTNHVTIIIIKKVNTPYHFKNGITVGTSLYNLLRFNKKPISFYGFNWDYYGKIIELNNGNLKTSLPYFGGVLIPKSNHDELSTKYSGDLIFDSNKIDKQDQKNIILEKLSLNLKR